LTLCVCPDGNVTGAYKVSVQDDTIIVLKKVNPFRIKDYSERMENLRSLRRFTSLPVELLGDFKQDNDIYGIWEYAAATRTTTNQDLDEALLELMTATVTCGWKQACQANTKLDSFFKKHLRDRFNIDYIKENHPEVYKGQESILTKQKELEKLFFSKTFKEEYDKLPHGFIHGDLKHDNLIVTKDGLKLIDFDESRIDARLCEMTRPIMAKSLNAEGMIQPKRLREEFIATKKLTEQILLPLEEKMLITMLLFQFLLANSRYLFYLRTPEKVHNKEHYIRKLNNRLQAMSALIDYFSVSV